MCNGWLVFYIVIGIIVFGVQIGIIRFVLQHEKDRSFRTKAGIVASGAPKAFLIAAFWLISVPAFGTSFFIKHWARDEAS